MPPPTPSTTTGPEDDGAESAQGTAAEFVADGVVPTVKASSPEETLPASPASWLATGSRLRFDWLGGQQASVDLTQRDRQRLFVDMRLDERSDVLEQALAELAVIGVDLPGTLRRVDHKAVFRVGRFEQIINGRVGDALRHWHGSGHAEVPPVVWIS